MLNNLSSCNILTEFYGSFCIKSIEIEEGKNLKYINANNVLSDDMIKDRNNEIFQKYNEGMTVRKLSLMYYLSEQSIRRIISEQNRLCL